MDPKARFDVAQSFAQQWISAWNSHDLEAIMEHYAAELHFCSPLILKRFPQSDGVIRDLEALRRYFSMGLQRSASLTFELTGVLCGVRGFTLTYINARGGDTTEYMELDEDGKASFVVVCYSAGPTRKKLA